MTATPAPQSKIVSWFWAARPFSLSASVAPVLVGTALAATVGALDWLLFALALTGSVAIQIGTNLTDEYSDHRKSGGEGKFLAPHKVIQRGLLSERAVALG
ncbi:MAG: 1,4-dihydroxy-2-naphthoate polyprenyltransferase, partial [Chloroflexi bacterium]|nr:1,4-dihydroxy-2-naphthoate polyprenyltransferase [Chloroflexota bacterium]